MIWNRDTELHTSDLTAKCLRLVQLRREGKALAEVPQAMFRGLLAGHALDYLHHHDLDYSAVGVAMVHGIDAIREEANSTGRIITDGTMNALEQIKRDVAEVLIEYCVRFPEQFPNGIELLGTEVPVAYNIPHPDGWGVVKLRSHIDLLFRHGDDLHCHDYKFRDAAPTPHYLNRNLQFGAYYLSLLRGQVWLGDEFAGGWQSLAEHSLACWVDLPSLKVYKRKTVVTEPDGSETVYAKGDRRPANRIWRLCNFTPESCDRIEREIISRTDMYEGGHFPAMTDPVGCLLCESEQWCQRLDKDVDK